MGSARSKLIIYEDFKIRENAMSKDNLLYSFPYLMKKKKEKRKIEKGNSNASFLPPPQKKDVNSTLIEVKALKNPSNSFLIEYLSIDELSNLI